MAGTANLPFLPGNCFSDPTKQKFHRSQTLTTKNGYAMPKRPEVGIGGDALQQNQLSEEELNDLANYTPTLTYKQSKQSAPEAFVPAHVAWDKKVLSFGTFLREAVLESPAETCRVRHFKLYYYLEDDSIAIVEPLIPNSGMLQGKYMKRQKIPKNEFGDNYSWKDLNVGIQIAIYGKMFYLYDCDKWTREFLSSEGIDVNCDGSAPSDYYISQRVESETIKPFKTPSNCDKLHQFIEKDRQVLRYFAVWDDSQNMFGEQRNFIIHYYLVDDSVEVREVYPVNCGRDNFPMFIKRQRAPKGDQVLDPSFPSMVLELTENEISDFLSPIDFQLRKNVKIFNRNFLLTDCDNFTKAYMNQNFGITDFAPVIQDNNKGPVAKREFPPYDGIGSMEDTLRTVMQLNPVPPIKNVIKLIENDGKVLRYEASLDTTDSLNSSRKFIISFYLADDMIGIYEKHSKNAGRVTGKFLEKCRVAKPGSPTAYPQFYEPTDFYIGAKIVIFKQTFIIDNADVYVLKYAQSHPNLFSAQVMENLSHNISTICN